MDGQVVPVQNHLTLNIRGGYGALPRSQTRYGAPEWCCGSHKLMCGINRSMKSQHESSHSTNNIQIVVTVAMGECAS